MQRYRARLSGPLLDRIDLQIQVPAVPWQELSAQRRGETSAVVAGRVERARLAQRDRQDGSGARCNADLDTEEISRWARPDPDGRRLLERAVRTLALSARAYHRVLRVARTVADLAGEEQVRAAHVAEAVAYRVLDRQDGPVAPFSAGVRG